MLNINNEITFVKSYGGSAVASDTAYPQAVAAQFSLNSPVGVCADQNGNVWVCDVGNSRVVIFSAQLDQIIDVITSPLARPLEVDPCNLHQLVMPFHVCAHPAKNWMYLTEMGNQRILAFEYTSSARVPGSAYAECVLAFDDEIVVNEISFDKLNTLRQSTQQNGSKTTQKNCYNGITLIADPSRVDGWCLYAADEFYQSGLVSELEPLTDTHAAQPAQRLVQSRIVCFTDAGNYLRHFSAVHVEAEANTHRLLWPQGLGSDSRGNLYIANTGQDEIIWCDPHSVIDADYQLISANLPGTTQLHTVQHATRNCYGTALRSVAVLDDQVFIAAGNSIIVYDLKNKKRGLILGEFSHTQNFFDYFHAETAHQAVDGLALACPYVICKADEAQTYYLSEPFLSRLVKVKINMQHNPALLPQATQVLLAQGLALNHFDFITSAQVIARVDQRRTQRRNEFNVVSSVFAVDFKPVAEARPPALPQTSNALLGFLNFGLAMVADTFCAYLKWWHALVPERRSTQLKKIQLAQHALFVVDMGNWKIKTLHQDKFRRFKRFSTAGTICVAVHSPAQPLFGQICLDKPILILTNMYFGTASMLQFDTQNELIELGLPFGLGIMKMPQGVAVSAQGEIYIADPAKNRVWQWRILRSGVVVLVNSLTPQKATSISTSATPPRNSAKPFFPTAVALDSKNRLFVCDHGNSAICVFDRAGNEVACFGSAGYSDGSADQANSFYLPTSIAIHDDKLIVNDLVNRTLKVFRITEALGKPSLSYWKGKQFFNRSPQQGGLWMPFFIFADAQHIYVPDCTFNVVNVYAY